MNDAIDVMEHLPFGVPTLKRDLNGLTQAVSARNRGFFYADHIDRTPAGQWVVLKRVRALVPFNTADPRALPSSRTTRPPSFWNTRAAGPSGQTPPGDAACSSSTSTARRTRPTPASLTKHASPLRCAALRRTG